MLSKIKEIQFSHSNLSDTLSLKPRWKFTTGLVTRQYHRADVDTGVVLAEHGVENGRVLVFVPNVTRLGVVGTGAVLKMVLRLYRKSVLALYCK